ncbi:hypothetical protein B0T14DRAFT_497813 [Immersiella caudata]|uniref:Uncharacterized protein n=1 Tax=Immersiella caudata TaxID=314043 RepID=A0AA39WJK8_9PEZI|nr:hypothetical protein B0T14DRAFT_497813 [Immersiella caudata]
MDDSDAATDTMGRQTSEFRHGIHSNTRDKGHQVLRGCPYRTFSPFSLLHLQRPPPHDDSADINPNGTGSQLLRMGVDLMRSSRQRSATVGSSRYRTPTPHPDRPRRHTAGVSAGEDEGYGGEYRIPPIPNLFEPFENLEDEPPTPPIPPKSPFRPPPVITVPSAWDIPSSSSSQYSRGRPSFSSSYPPRPTTHYLDNPGFRDHPNRRFAFVESSPRHRDSLIATIDGAETNYDGEDEYEYDTCRQNDHSRKNMRSRRAASNVPRSRDQPPPVQQPPSQPLPRSNQRARNRPRGEQNLHTPASSDGVCKEQRSRGRQRTRFEPQTGTEPPSQVRPPKSSNTSGTNTRRGVFAACVGTDADSSSASEGTSSRAHGRGNRGINSDSATGSPSFSRLTKGETSWAVCEEDCGQVGREK